MEMVSAQYMLGNFACAIIDRADSTNVLFIFSVQRHHFAEENMVRLIYVLPGGKRILIIKMRAQHITFSKAIKAITVRF